MKGFSLIELLISIAIFGILLIGGLGQFNNVTAQNILSFCQNFNSFLDTIYLESRLKQQEIEINFDTNKNLILISKPPNNQPRTYNLPPKIKISSAKFSGINNKKQSIVFKNSTSNTTTANNGTVIFSNTQGKSCSIIQSLYGARRYE
ncbi:MAG: prepilin-type N-terminal cleavage/methylation domain-containing protein [Deltaproteobacteria bacterium]|jgi:prepilin-type N-terminal cleavage/methylation domain-containing protein|nr:prepilin-type N-terminal cleavage/methylation domain-containing protein [Deltaproteobacteria bacterium]